MSRPTSIGTGPLCPVNNEHGRLYSWDDGRWYCPTNSHGGNGKFFTDAEARGAYEVTEQDVAVIYEQAARDIVAKRTTLDQAVLTVSRLTKRSTASVREALTLMVKAIEEHNGTGETMAEKKAAAAKTKKAAAATAAPKDTSRRQEHAGPEKFQAILDELQMTNKQAAEATGDAGMGSSATYIYILTHKGASQKLFEKFEAACRTWAAAHPFEDEAEATEEAEEATEAEPEAEAVEA